METQEPDEPRRRKGGRPPKPKEVRRKIPISSAYTEEEKSRLSALADSAGRAISIYQREAALNGKVAALDKDAGFRISILRQFLSEAKYCRATLHKIERHLAGKEGHEKAIRALNHIDELIMAATIALRKEVGLDPG